MTVFFFNVGFYVPLENFSLIWRPHHYSWRVAKFDLYLTLIAIEQWGFFNVQHLLLKLSYPRTRDIHTCCQTFSNGAVTTFLRLSYVSMGDRTPIPCVCGERSTTKTPWPYLYRKYITSSMQFQRRILEIYSNLMPKQWRGVQTFKQNCLRIFISKTFIVELILTNPIHVVCFRTLKWRRYCSSISFSYSSYFEVGCIIWFNNTILGTHSYEGWCSCSFQNVDHIFVKRLEDTIFSMRKTCEYICTVFLIDS